MTDREASGTFEFRGVVEGFYGPAYTQADRLWLVDRMSDWGMNVYVHAPKDDPLGREAWRTPYPDAAMAEFRALVERGDARSVRVGFALSPGLSIEYASAADRAALVQKLVAFARLGARFFCLALDDVSSELEHAEDRAHFDSLGAAHADLASHVLEALPDDATLWLVPTDYAGTGSSSYLEALACGLPARVEVGWTGRTVVSPTITRDEARRRSAALGRRLLIWDNVPVNDGPMRRALHLGPYVGRDADLPESVSGLLLNPMQQPRASAIALQCAGAYMRAPHEYDAETAWRSAVREAAPGAEAAFETFARAHRFSALLPDDRDQPLEAAFEALRRSLEAGDSAAEASARALAELRDLVAARTRSRDEIETGLRDTQLARELTPWLEAHELETRRIEIALDFIAILTGAGTALERALAFFTLQGRLGRLGVPIPISYGPRRAIYPQLVSLANEEAHFGADPVLFRDRNLAEEIVRFAEALGLARLGGPD